MANTNDYYPGETLPFDGALTDRNDENILFTDVIAMTIVAVDRPGTTKTYTKTDGDITVGDATNKWQLVISDTDSADFKPGPLRLCIEFTFNDADVGIYKEYDEYVPYSLKIRHDGN